MPPIRPTTYSPKKCESFKILSSLELLIKCLKNIAFKNLSKEILNLLLLSSIDIDFKKPLVFNLKGNWVKWLQLIAFVYSVKLVSVKISKNVPDKYKCFSFFKNLKLEIKYLSLNILL